MSIQKAIDSEKKVKVITENGEKYTFKKIKKEDSHHIGITSMNSATARKVAGMRVSIEDNKLKVDLSEMSIEKIKLRNNTLSTVVNIAVPLVMTFVTLTIIAYQSMDLGDMDSDINFN